MEMGRQEVELHNTGVEIIHVGAESPGKLAMLTLLTKHKDLVLNLL